MNSADLPSLAHTLRALAKVSRDHATALRKVGEAAGEEMRGRCERRAELAERRAEHLEEQARAAEARSQRGSPT